MINNQSNENKGMPCPQCDFSIKFSIHELLMNSTIQCPGCHLNLEMQVPGEIKSHLQDIDRAQTMLDSTRHMKR